MIIWQEQMIYARYHGFLADMAEMSNRLIQENHPLYAMYENMLPSLLNDVRDILDPEQNIPIFFLEKDELVNQMREEHSISPSFH